MRVGDYRILYIIEEARLVDSSSRSGIAGKSIAASGRSGANPSPMSTERLHRARRPPRPFRGFPT